MQEFGTICLISYNQFSRTQKGKYCPDELQTQSVQLCGIFIRPATCYMLKPTIPSVLTIMQVVKCTHTAWPIYERSSRERQPAERFNHRYDTEWKCFDKWNSSFTDLLELAFQGNQIGQGKFVNSDLEFCILYPGAKLCTKLFYTKYIILKMLEKRF